MKLLQQLIRFSIYFIISSKCAATSQQPPAAASLVGAENQPNPVSQPQPNDTSKSNAGETQRSPENQLPRAAASRFPYTPAGYQPVGPNGPMNPDDKPLDGEKSKWKDLEANRNIIDVEGNSSAKNLPKANE